MITAKIVIENLSSKRLDKMTKEIQFGLIVKNTTNDTKKVILFDAFLNTHDVKLFDKQNQYNFEGVKVKLLGSSIAYQEFLHSINFRPCQFNLITIKNTDIAKLVFIKKDFRGEYVPQVLNGNKQDGETCFITEEPLTIDCFSKLEINNLEPNTEIEITFFN